MTGPPGRLAPHTGVTPAAMSSSKNLRRKARHDDPYPRPPAFSLPLSDCRAHSSHFPRATRLGQPGRPEQARSRAEGISQHNNTRMLRFERFHSQPISISETPHGSHCVQNARVTSTGARCTVVRVSMFVDVCGILFSSTSLRAAQPHLPGCDTSHASRRDARSECGLSGSTAGSSLGRH